MSGGGNQAFLVRAGEKTEAEFVGKILNRVGLTWPGVMSFLKMMGCSAKTEKMDNPKLHNKEWRVMDTRHDTVLWGFEYDDAPYLEHVSDGALDKRYIDIINNVDYLVCDLRDVLPVEAHFLSSWWWQKVKFHTEREYSRRKRALPTITSLPPAPGLKIPYVPSHPNESNFIVKYGEASWLEPMLQDGIIRINPASKYRGEVAKTDTARHDDELKMHRYKSGRGTTVTVLPTGQSAPIIGNIQHTIGGPNYYVFCCSNEFDYRLFHAFKNDKGQSADSCLVIRDVDEFAKRVEAVVQKKLPEWRYYWEIVAYYDPYNVPRIQPVSPGVCKDFQYAYQREYRFVWRPLSYPGAKEFFDVNIGSLEDIAELHYYPP